MKLPTPRPLLLVCLLQCLQVSPAAASGAPANDNFANAIQLDGLTVEAAGRLGGATAEPGEARLTQGPNELPSSIWWKWKVPRDGDVLVELLIDSSRPPLFSFYPRLEMEIAEGDDMESLRVLSWTSSSYRGGYLGRTCVFRGQTGKTVYIRLTGDRILLDEGYRIRISMPAFPVILEPPKDVPVPFADAVLRDRGALMTVRAVDGSADTNAPPNPGTLRYQWYKDGQPLDGRTNNFLFYESTYPVRRDGLYAVVVTGASGSVTSSPVRLELVRFVSGLPRLKATIGLSGRTALEMEGLPGQIYQLQRSRDLVDWHMVLDDFGCSFAGGHFSMGFNGMRLVINSSLANAGYYRLVEYNTVTDFSINEHLQLIEFRKSELARRLEGSAKRSFLSEHYPSEQLFDQSAPSWELGGMTPLRIEEIYNLNSLGTCATATLPADVSLGFIARGGTVQLEWALQGPGAGW